jgi:hypothetical protein
MSKFKAIEEMFQLESGPSVFPFGQSTFFLRAQADVKPGQRKKVNKTYDGTGTAMSKLTSVPGTGKSYLKSLSTF